MNFTSNFVVNYEGRSELVKVAPEVSFEMFWKMIVNLYNIHDSTDLFLYAVPNDFSYPIFLSSSVYASLQKATYKIGNNNVIHLRILTPASFVFEVNPTHFTSTPQQGAIQDRGRMTLNGGPVKSITADVEGFYWEDKNTSEHASDAGIESIDPETFIKEHTRPEGITAQIIPNHEASTFELKDSKNNSNFAARIQIKNTGSKKFLAMNWCLKQVMCGKGGQRSYPLPDLEPEQTYDLIFNLNMRLKRREVTYWSLSLMDSNAEEVYFGPLIKAELKENHPELSLIEENDIPTYVSGITPKQSSTIEMKAEH